MSWLSDAHAEWHIVNGPRETTSCPLDCYDPPEPDPVAIVDGVTYYSMEDARLAARHVAALTGKSVVLTRC